MTLCPKNIFKQPTEARAMVQGGHPLQHQTAWTQSYYGGSADKFTFLMQCPGLQTWVAVLTCVDASLLGHRCHIYSWLWHSGISFAPVRPEVYLVAAVPLIRPRENELRAFKSLSKTNNLNEIISKQLTNPNYASDQKTGKPRKLSRLP